MKATITIEVTAEEASQLLDKLREHRIADQKEWEENHPPMRPAVFGEEQPLPPFMTEEPEKKKTKPN